MIDLDRLTPILSRKQILSIVGAQQTPQIAIWDGAVSSGKTIASLIAFLVAVASAPSSGLIVIVGKAINTIEANIVNPLQDPAIFGPLAAQTRHTTGATMANILGRDVRLIGANDVRSEGRIRGSTICLAYVDEATLVPKSFWMMLLSRLRVPNAKLFATTNPDNPSHYLKADFIDRGLDVGVVRWHFVLADNPTNTVEYVERLKRQYTGLWYRRFIEGLWVLAEGAIFDMWDPARHLVDLLPPIERWVAMGIDYGTANPFAALTLGLGVDHKLYLAHEWWWNSRQNHRQLTDVEYSQRVRDWLDGLPFPGTDIRGIRPQYVVVDPSAASFIAQIWQDGLTPTPGDNAVCDGIRTVSSLLAQDRLSVHRSCKNLINELPGYSWDSDKAEKGEDAPIKVDDHAVDAMRYAIHTTRSVWRSQLQLQEAA